MVRIVACSLLLLLAGCSLDRDATVTPPPPATTDATVAVSTTIATTTPPTTVPTAGECPEGDVMLADGGILDFERGTFDGTRIAGITWRMDGDCQRLVISFATDDGAPATTPPALTARILRNAGVLRIETAATASVVSDQLIEEGSLERMFVPLDEQGNRFVDLVLAGPAVARARVLTSPARLELELQPGGPDVGRPLTTPNVVVVEPGSAAEADGVLDVTGYSIGEVESLTVEVLSGDRVVVDDTLELEPSPNLWSAFHLVLPVGEEIYDTLRITAPDGSVVAAIPFNR